MFILGVEMAPNEWKARFDDDREFRSEAQRLVWQCNGRRFIPFGEAVTPPGPVTPAHPVELDAPEILRLRALLRKRRIVQPFRQMDEPVILRDGALPGNLVTVACLGEPFAMLDRYAGYTLRREDVAAQWYEDYEYITWRSWDQEERKTADRHVVHIITPAGVFYSTRLDNVVRSITGGNYERMALGMFWPREGARKRTLNHVAAVFERALIPQMIARDDLDMLLPHLASMTGEDIASLRPSCPDSGKVAAFIDHMNSGKEGMKG